jgi:hypothetical protein
MFKAMGAGGQDLFVSRSRQLVVVRQTPEAAGDVAERARQSLFEPKEFFTLLGSGVTATADTDGDLIPDRTDAFPHDPAEWLDGDADDLGDEMEWHIVKADPLDEITGVLEVNPHDDFDGDGYTNRQEDSGGTDATRSASFPRIQSITRSGDTLRLQWPSTVGRLYTVETNSTLEATGWGPSSFTEVPGTGATMTADLPLPPDRLFYRLKIKHWIAP